MRFLAYSGYFDLIGLRVVWLVCGWFVGGLAGLCVVWLVCGWFRVLQQTNFNISLQSLTSISHVNIN